MFTEQQFSIPKLQGISEKTIEEHLKLYAGYVKNANLIKEHIDMLSKEAEKYTYELGELHRRFSFEWGGMRNHEQYFKLLETKTDPDPESALFKAIELQWGSIDHWKAAFSMLASTRGIGWAVLYWDPESKQLIHGWIDEQHLGALINAMPIIMLDMWEHSFVIDYFPSGKKQYVHDFLAQMNWKFAEANFVSAKSMGALRS
jgi:superoxide dismutase, Fe-Mn family